MLSLSTLAIVLAILAAGGFIAMAMKKRPVGKGAPPAGGNRQEALLRGAFERSPAGIGYLDAEGKWLFTNRRLLQLLGYDLTELMKYPLRNLTHAEDRKREARLYGDLHGGRTTGYTIVKRLLRKTRDYREYRVQMNRCADAPPVFQCVLQEWVSEATGVDSIADALEEFDQTAVIRCDSTGTIRGWNRGAERLFGYTPTDVVGSNWARLHPGNAAVNSQKLSEAAQKGVRQSTEPRLRNDGRQVSVHSTIVSYGHSRDAGTFVEICRPAEEAESAIDAMRAEHETLRKELAKRDALEVELRGTVATVRATNAELSRKVRLLANALRKLLTEPHKAAAAAAAKSFAAPAPAPAPAEETIEWVDIAGSEVAEVLKGVVAESRTGTLRLRSDEGETRLIFARGHLVACASEKDERFLGQLLVDAGLITDEQRKEALEVHRTNGVPFGSSIVSLGLLSQESLAHFIRAKTKEELADVARWETVRTTFVSSESTPESLVPVEIDVMSLVSELTGGEPAPVAATPVETPKASGRSGRRRSGASRAASRQTPR